MSIPDHPGMGEPIITTGDVESHVRLIAYECKFTVESREGTGGDFERNVGGSRKEQRVTFEGYASPEMCDALIAAIGKVVGNGS